MLEKGKISSLQMGVMMYPTIMATAILIVPSITGEHAKHDMWLSPIIASLIGFLTVFLAYRLHKLYPNQSLIEYVPQIIGKFPGKMLGLLYILFYLHMTGLIVRDYSEFIIGAFLLHTPVVVVAATMLIFSAFAVRGGIEVVARSAFIFTILFFVPVVLTSLLIPDLDVKNVLPFMEHGIVPALKGAVVPAGLFSEFFLIAFILPYVMDKEKGLKSGMISVFAVMLVLTFTNFIILFLYGIHTGNMLYPVLLAFRQINVGGFFENFEAFIMATWVLGNFVKISLYFYVASLATGQWLKLSDYRPIVFPLGILILCLSFWGVRNVAILNNLIERVNPFYLITVQTIIPIFLLIIALLRTKYKLQRRSLHNE